MIYECFSVSTRHFTIGKTVLISAGWEKLLLRILYFFSHDTIIYASAVIIVERNIKMCVHGEMDLIT